MFKTGLVTVSFRPLSPKEVVDLAVKAGLEMLEWGGDIHVPPNDFDNAYHVAALTKKAGLTTTAYGSYYRLGVFDDQKSAFLPILNIACILEAPIIRIWGGIKGSEKLTKEDWSQLVTEGRILVDMASKKGITVSLECHPDTLTDDYESTLRFLQEVPGMTTYWQPNQFKSEEYNKKAARTLAPFTTNIHVFHWDATNAYPLEEGMAIWQEYLTSFNENNHNLLLEFMHDGRIESLNDTAEVLRKMIATQKEKFS